MWPWALLEADDDGRLHPVAFWSKTLNPSQRNYHVTDRECLALVEAIHHWSPFLYPAHFTVFTDHRALECLNKTGFKEEEEPASSSPSSKSAASSSFSSLARSRSISLS